MKENKKAWKKSIVNALIQKGFTTKQAKITATQTIRKSIAKESVLNRRRDHATDWKAEMKAHADQCRKAFKMAEEIRKQAAINKRQPVSGTIVVVHPARQK